MFVVVRGAFESEDDELSRAAAHDRGAGESTNGPKDQRMGHPTNGPMDRMNGHYNTLYIFALTRVDALTLKVCARVALYRWCGE